MSDDFAVVRERFAAKISEGRVALAPGTPEKYPGTQVFVRILDAEALLAALARIEAERDKARARLLTAQDERDDLRREAQRRIETLMAERDKAREEAERLAETLREIVARAKSAWGDVDDDEDTGVHVGVTRHHRATAGGLSIAAGIARAALAAREEER